MTVADPEQTVKVPRFSARTTLVPLPIDATDTVKLDVWRQVEELARSADFAPTPKDRLQIYSLPGYDSPVARVREARYRYMLEWGVAPHCMFYSVVHVFNFPQEAIEDYNKHDCTICAIPLPSDIVIVWGKPYE